MKKIFFSLLCLLGILGGLAEINTALASTAVTRFAGNRPLNYGSVVRGLQAKVAFLRRTQSLNDIWKLPSEAETHLNFIASDLGTLAGAGDHRLADIAKNRHTHDWDRQNFFNIYPTQAKIENFSPPKVENFLRHIIQQQDCVECLIPAYVYLATFQRQTGLILSSANLPGLILTAFLVAEKFHVDDHLINREWSQKYHVNLTKLAEMETDFLKNIDFRLNISEEEYRRVRTQLYNLKPRDAVRRRMQ